MKLDQIEITHFEKGMVESMELGQSFNNQYSAPVVKYLENLTPNLIQGALVKRLNYTTFSLLGTTTSTEGLLPQSDQYSNNIYLDYAGKRYIQGYWPHKYIRVPDPLDQDFRIYVHMLTGEEVQSDPLYGSLLSRHLSLNLVGMERFDMRNPVAGNVYVAMLRDDITIDGQRYTTTSINGYYYSKALTGKASSGEGWLNPLYDPEYFELQGNQFVGVPFTQKGRRVNGIVQDWVVVGQVLYLVSVPDKVHATLSAQPVYRWSPVTDAKEAPSVFFGGLTNRTHYKLTSESDIKTRHTAIMSPFGFGDYRYHPQYRGNSNLLLSDTTRDKAEIIDFDGIKSSVDVVWWQTNKLPDMKDMAGKTLDLPYLSMKSNNEQDPDRVRRMVANLKQINIMENSVSDNRRRVLTSEGKAISANNLPSRKNPGKLTPVEYWYVQMFEVEKKNNDWHFVEYDSVPIGGQTVGYYSEQVEPGETLPYLGDPAFFYIYQGMSIYSGLRTQPDSTQRFAKVYFGANNYKQTTYIKLQSVVYIEYFDDIDTLVEMQTGEEFKLSQRRMTRPLYSSWFRVLFASRFPITKNGQPSYSLLPDYKKADFPRLWQTGSQIPYLLTVMLDGVEFVVLQDVYTVADSDMVAELNETSFVTQPLYLPNMDFSPLSAIVRNVTDTTNTEFDDFAQASRSPLVCFTLRINLPHTQSIWDLVPQGVTSFKLYVSMPNPATSGFFDASGDWAQSKTGEDPSPGCYTLPQVTDKVSRAYSLVKEFLIKEDKALQTDGIADDFYSYNFGDQGWKSVAHGKWVKFPNPEPFVGQETNIPQLIDFGGSGYYYIPYSRSEFGLNPTPDFYLWDYASGPALTDNLRTLSVGWDGIGARCITQVSNRIVIGGTIDKDNTEEIGRIRASAVQGTTMLNTVFAELDALDVSSTPIYALLNFRNDLWVFSRNSIVRINPTNPYDMATWQIIDTITGQGIQNRKHVTQTPTGIFFANSTGLWFANGSEIKNVSLPVLQSYKMLYDQNSAEWQGYNKYTLMPHMGAYNDSFELSYSPQNNEVVLSARAYRSADNLADVPGNGNIDLQMRYSIDLDNWYIVSVDLPPGRYLNQTFAHSVYGRVRFIDSDGKLAMPILYDRSLTWAKQSNGYYDDMMMPYLYDRISALMFPESSQLFQMLTYAWRTWYAGWVTLHEIGDGLDDYLLRQVIVEAVPIEHSPFQLQPGLGAPDITWRDPKLFIQYRNRENRNWANALELAPEPFPTDAGTYDLVELNSRLVANPDIYWSHLNMPISRAFSRESLVLNTPLDSKFRRLEATFVTTSLSYLKGFRFKFAKFIRKTFG